MTAESKHITRYDTNTFHKYIIRYNTLAAETINYCIEEGNLYF